MTDLRRSVIEAARRHGLGGVAVAVIRRGEPVSMACLGLADQASGREITPDTGLFVPIAFRPAQRGRDSILCAGAPALATLHRRPAWRSPRVRLQNLASAALAGATLRRLVSRREPDGS